MDIARIRDLVHAGRKIEAIRLYREQSGAGLKEAKDAVDAMEREGDRSPAMPPQPASHPLEDPSNIRALLSTYAENLSAQAQAGGRYDIYYRDAEVTQILQALASPLKGRVVVIGPPRVGKTAVVQMVAQCLATGQCPPELAGKEMWRLALSSLPGFSTPGQWRATLDGLMKAWARHPEIILVFDDLARVARLTGGRGQSDEDEDDGEDVAALLVNTLRHSGLNAAVPLAAALKHNPGLCLAEAEENAWRRFSEAHSDYQQLFLPVRIAEPDLPTARQIVRRAAEDLGVLHGVAVTDEAIDQALDLSQRYALDQVQPGKTIDLLRDTLAVAATGDTAQLTAKEVIRRFGEQSGLPRMLLDDTVPFGEADVLRYFKQRVLAQDQAVEAIVQALSLLRARVNNPLRPMGVFLFLGPTGVGKTELARTLAEYLYGTHERLMRFNMADYAHWHQHTELFGNPHGRTLAARRGQLTNRLAGKLFSVIVLDEFEKAHPLIYQRFLQLFDEGLLINGHDELVNLRNSIMIVTSNFGAQLVEQGRIGFNVGETLEAREKEVLSKTEQYFTPEFMNRIDAVCVFHPLNRSVMADIARREIGDLLQREGLTRRQFEIDITDEVIEQVVALGYSPHYGARYLKRQIEKTITYPLAREINTLPADTVGGTLRLYLKHGRVTSAYLPPVSARPTPPPAAEAPLSITLAEMRRALPVLAARVEALEEMHGVTAARVERDTILNEMADVSFWNDQAAARRKLDAYQRASSTVDLLGSLRQALDSLTENCASGAPPLEAAARPYKFLLGELPRIEFASWLSGPHDACGAYVQISIKSKLASARQWVATLAKMYLNWARRRRVTASVLGEEQSPDGRSFSALLAISGFGVYGLLQGETGTHRLVQLAKVGGQEIVQKLSASVVVMPELPDDELPAAPPDLDVAVKPVNRNGLLLPGLTSQVTVRRAGSEQRLSFAGNLLPDDLAAEASRIVRTSLHLQSTPIALPAPPPGGLVRSYVRSTKEKGVHDHRTGQRTLKVKQVLDGDLLQDFLDAALKQRSRS